MVILHTEAAGETTFTILPNCSLSWGGMKTAFSVLSAALICVAVYFAALGAWLVIPFTGLEILLIAAGLYSSARRGATREVVQIGQEAVAIYRGRRRLTEIGRFSRPWARVKLLQDAAGWYPGKLLILSHGRRVEVGAALTEEERSELARRLTERLRLYPALEPLPANGGLSELEPARQQI